MVKHLQSDYPYKASLYSAENITKCICQLLKESMEIMMKFIDSSRILFPAIRRQLDYQSVRKELSKGRSLKVVIYLLVFVWE